MLKPLVQYALSITINDLVCIKNLNMKAMSQALQFGKSVADNGWGMIGKGLIKIDKWFPSSKTCSVCGAIKKSLTLSERSYVCDCGAILDRDINAAINIKGLLVFFKYKKVYETAVGMKHFFVDNIIIIVYTESCQIFAVDSWCFERKFLIPAEDYVCL